MNSLPLSPAQIAARVAPIEITGSTTATIDRDHIVTATATLTDPTPAQGKGYTVTVRNGTATVGGTGYTAGWTIVRTYHSGAWAQYAFPSTGVAVTWTASQTFQRSTSGTAVLVDRTLDSLNTDLTFTTGTIARWRLRLATAEGGSNAGGDLILIRVDDTGTNLGNLITFNRQNGQIITSAGSAANPVVALSDTSLGFYRVSANVGGITCGGVQIGSFSSTALTMSVAVLSTSQTLGVGYGTGAGGTVTQITSRTTGVTLNRVTGAITLVSAAGSATYQSFTVTNSAVAATDSVIVNQVSGTDLYETHVTAVAAGSFRITFRTTGGTTTEQPVFRFTVIKSVSA